MKDASTVFDQNTLDYDNWFERHKAVYQSEILAAQKAIPAGKRGIEIGMGTGRFAQPLQIKSGVEPSDNMAQVGEQRGIEVIRAFAEDLPIKDGIYDFALMVTTVCFLSDIPKAFSEAYRILKSNGEIILAIIDKNSELCRKYEKGKSGNKFYKDAHFHSTEEITELLKESGFKNFNYWQTLTSTNQNEIEQPTQGYGKGSFVVIKATK